VINSARESRNGGNALVAAVRGVQLPGVWGPDAVKQLTQAADHHGIVLALYRSYQRGDLTVEDVAALATLAHRRRAGALQITVSALDVSEWLQQAGIRHAILKGPAVAAAYDDADREFVDLDVLVAPGCMLDAIAIIEEHGGRHLEADPWPRPDGVAELSILLRRGVPIDLHAHLVVHAKERSAFILPTEPLLNRATTASILGHDLPVLDPEDTLIHVALHAMVSGGERLVWLADLDALVRQGHIAWPTLVRRAHNARAALVVGVMLDRAVLNLGTPVPRDVLRALHQRGAIWAQMLRLFERWHPTAANYDRSFRGQVLVRSTRVNTSVSMATLGRLIWTDVILFVVSNPNHPWRVRTRQRWQRG
jgi:hypothetical protein